MKKTTWIIIFVVIVILIIILLLLAFKRDDKNKYGGGETCPDGSPIPASGNCGTGAVTPNTGECVQPAYYTEWQFPISFGMKGSRVLELQHKLNIKYMAGLKEDGYFGCKTLGAVKEYLGTDKVYTTNPIWAVPESIKG